jgi:hypothetical protein
MHNSMNWKSLHGVALHIAAVGLLVTAFVGSGCSGDDGGGVGDACEVDADCKEGLRCRGGECVEPTGGNNGNPDAGDTGEDGDTGDTPMEEDYFVSYVIADTLGGSNRELRVWSTADQTETTLDLGDVDCANGCWINRNASHVIFKKPTVSGPDNSDDVFKIPLDASLTPQGDASSAEEIAQGVTGVRVIENVVTFKEGDTAKYHNLADGSENELDAVGDSGWYVNAEANVSLIYDPVPATRQNLDIYMGDASGGAQKVFQVNSENYQEIGGSYYGSDVPTAVSPDGSIVAFVTSGPNNYDRCEDASECAGPEKKCGFMNFCTRRELTVRFIEVANKGDLGMPCGGEGTCGDIHECYQPSDGTEDAVCVPGRVVVGVPKSPERPAAPGDSPVNGCELTKDALDSHPYTAFNGPFSFDAQGNFYGVGVRDCTEQTGAGYSNIAQGDIVRIDPRSGELERIYGNFGEEFDPDNDGEPDDPDACYDVDEMELLPQQCNVYVDGALLSPGGNEFAFTATNMNVTDPSLAKSTLDIWTVLSNGEDVSWEAEHNQDKTVKSFNVHPVP